MQTKGGARFFFCRRDFRKSRISAPLAGDVVAACSSAVILGRPETWRRGGLVMMCVYAWSVPSELQWMDQVLARDVQGIWSS